MTVLRLATLKPPLWNEAHGILPNLLAVVKRFHRNDNVLAVVYLVTTEDSVAQSGLGKRSDRRMASKGFVKNSPAQRQNAFLVTQCSST
jgi:hypothetical protein